MYFNYISMINHIIGSTFSYDIFRVIFFIYLIKPEQNGKYSTNGKTMKGLEKFDNSLSIYALPKRWTNFNFIWFINFCVNHVFINYKIIINFLSVFWKNLKISGQFK